MIDLYKFEFSKEEIDYLIENAGFNHENGEIDILLLRWKGKSNIQIAMQLKMSERTVNRRIKSIVKKILKVIR